MFYGRYTNGWTSRHDKLTKILKLYVERVTGSDSYEV